MKEAFCTLIILFLLVASVNHLPVMASAVKVNAEVPSECGNNVKEFDEQCDGADLGGASCVSQGFHGGTLSCNADCTFNTSDCTTAPFVTGGPGAYPPPPPPKPVLPTGDFNADGLINFIDLSIMLYWFGKTSAEASFADLNGDGQINYVDVSILLYRWTG